jgi:hypothetical protein
MKALWQVADFMRGLHREMRFGELSRAPLRLLRFELRGEVAECDWMARPPDVWDASLGCRMREHTASEQALRDAIRVRDLVFAVLPDVESAMLRAFRPSAAREPPELIIIGAVHRGDADVYGGTSLVMHAKLSGLRFCLDGERLESMPFEEFEMSL